MLTRLLNSISPQFTAALTLYSGTFMRYAMAVTPKNYLLFACHFINFNSQLVQGYRWYDFNYQGGKAKWDNIKKEADRQAGEVEGKAEGIVNQVKDKAQEVKKSVS